MNPASPPLLPEFPPSILPSSPLRPSAPPMGLEWAALPCPARLGHPLPRLSQRECLASCVNLFGAWTCFLVITGLLIHSRHEGNWTLPCCTPAILYKAETWGGLHEKPVTAKGHNPPPAMATSQRRYSQVRMASGQHV